MQGINIIVSWLDVNKHLWRNRLARSAVNRKVAGSSPARCELRFFSSFFVFMFSFFTQNKQLKILLNTTKTCVNSPKTEYKQVKPVVQ